MALRTEWASQRQRGNESLTKAKEKFENSFHSEFLYICCCSVMVSHYFEHFFSRKIPSSAPQSSIHSWYIYVFLLFLINVNERIAMGLFRNIFFFCSTLWNGLSTWCRRNCASVEFFDKFICVWNSWWMAWPSAMIFSNSQYFISLSQGPQANKHWTFEEKTKTVVCVRWFECFEWSPTRLNNAWVFRERIYRLRQYIYMTNDSSTKFEIETDNQTTQPLCPINLCSHEKTCVIQLFILLTWLHYFIIAIRWRALSAW